jgi:hypothetical protein
MLLVLRDRAGLSSPAGEAKGRGSDGVGYLLAAANKLKRGRN